MQEIRVLIEDEYYDELASLAAYTNKSVADLVRDVLVSDIDHMLND